MNRNLEVSLNTLNNGAALDLFNAEFARVLENIGDPNTKPDAVREIIIRIKFKPDKTRSIAPTLINAKSNLAPIMPHESLIHLAQSKGKFGAYIDDSQQLNLYEDPPTEKNKHTEQ